MNQTLKLKFMRAGFMPSLKLISDVNVVTFYCTYYSKKNCTVILYTRWSYNYKWKHCSSVNIDNIEVYLFGYVNFNL